MHVCNPAVRSCKNETEIREFMKYHTYNLYILQQRAELGRVNSTDMLKTQFLFHSQFLLDYEKYRDNNNFIRHNSLKFTTNRWSLAPQEFDQEFLDYTAFPTWVGDNFRWPLNTSRDGGKTWTVERYTMVFGAYFFLSEDKVEQYKMVSNISEVIAIIEGVASLIFMFAQVIPRCINRKQLEAKTIRHCYFDVDEKALDDSEDPNLPVKPMKFRCWDKISTFKRYFLKAICPCLKETQILEFFSLKQLTYLRAFDHFKHELNLFQLLQTVHKLKACVQVLLNEDMEKLLQIKQLYFHQANIHLDRHILERESQVRHFLDRDEKKLLYRQ